MKHDNHAFLMVALALALGLLIVFVDLTPTGKVTRTTVNISQSVPSNCTVTVANGYNLVSWPCLTTQESRSEIVDDTNLIAMYRYVPGSSDPWKVHNPELPEYVVSDLTFLSRKDGYIMLMNDNDAFPHEGFRVAFTSIGLAQGWNLVGYPSNLTEDSATTLGSIASIVAARTYQNGTWRSYPGTLTETVPGQAYWINVSAADVWGVTS